MFTFNELIALHHQQIDNVHKLWNYFWLATFATFTIGGLNKPLIIYLLLGYVVFALINARLILMAQREACLSASAIKSQADAIIKSQADAAKEKHLELEWKVVDSIQPWKPETIFKGHLLLTGFVVVVLGIMRAKCGAVCENPADDVGTAGATLSAASAEPAKPEPWLMPPMPGDGRFSPTLLLANASQPRMLRICYVTGGEGAFVTATTNTYGGNVISSRIYKGGCADVGGTTIELMNQAATAAQGTYKLISSKLP